MKNYVFFIKFASGFSHESEVSSCSIIKATQYILKSFSSCVKDEIISFNVIQR
jgi:hypothetical protein